MADNIFIIDDDPVFRKILNKRLSQKGNYNIKEYSSAEESFSHLPQKPKYIFLDFSLNGLNGLDALRRYRIELPKSKVFLITHLTDEKLKEKCLENGAKVFVTKPEFLENFPPEIEKEMKSNFFSF